MSGASGSSTAQRAAKLLVERSAEYLEPTAKQKRNLVMAFASRNMIIYGRAFDVIRVSAPVDLDSLESVERNLKHLVLCEIKSTRRPLKKDFHGFFFALTAAEVLVAQSLKGQFRFIFLNVNTGEHIEMRLNEVFGRARGIYPTWSLMF